MIDSSTAHFTFHAKVVARTGQDVEIHMRSVHTPHPNSEERCSLTPVLHTCVNSASSLELKVCWPVIIRIKLKKGKIEFTRSNKYFEGQGYRLTQDWCHIEIWIERRRGRVVVYINTQHDSCYPVTNKHEVQTNGHHKQQNGQNDYLRRHSSPIAWLRRDGS